MNDRFLRLILMRHAKSSWTSEAATDHRRPLNERGRTDAPRIGQRLAELGWTPEWVLSSDSARTQETWSLMADALPSPRDVQFTRRLYHGGIPEIVEALHDTPNDLGCLLALGHNPGWEDVAEWLSGEPIRMTTANAVLLRHDAVPWSHALERGAWSVVDVLRPKELF